MSATDAKVASAAAISVIAGGALMRLAGGPHALPLAPQLHGTAADFTSILVRNSAVCSPLVLAVHIRGPRARWLRNLIDVLAALVVAPTSFTVGAIAGQTGGLAYLPHAPFELSAIALAAGWWWRPVVPRPSATFTRLAMVHFTLVAAAALETLAVPHVPRRTGERVATRAAVVACTCKPSQSLGAALPGPTPVGPAAATGKPSGCRPRCPRFARRRCPEALRIGSAPATTASRP